MPTAILGISAFYHDSAAALVVDGVVAAAAQEERFTRVRHDASFPAEAVASCLRTAGLTEGDLDYVAFYDKPFSKFERLLETYVAYAPAGLRSFSRAMPLWLGGKIATRRTIRAALPGARRARLVFADHHESHAASAYLPSPFEDAAILTIDGVGEWSTAAYGRGQGGRVALDHHLEFPHSLGLLYSAFTYYCGFKVNSGEYKLMGLAPFGQPSYAPAIYEHLVDVKPDGSLWLDMRYFNFCQGLTMTSGRFHDLFGGPPRRPDAVLEPRHKDLAASIQAVTEEVVLRMGRHVHRETGLDRLVMAGGVALNCVATGRLRREGPFADVWIQPAAGDAGGALGAAMLVWHQLLEQPRAPAGVDGQRASLLGPAFGDAEVRAILDAAGVPYVVFGPPEDLAHDVAGRLESGQVIGWFQGRMEFGPRALGARSILADPRGDRMQEFLNIKIKRRESFRPFAPCVLAERVHEWFDVAPGHESPYMAFVAPVRSGRRLPAVTHVDGTARLQTVDAGRHPRLHALLTAFHARTGCPVLVNTSFNVRGEPIVCTPADALRCFRATDLDALVIGDAVVPKAGLPADSTAADYLAAIAPD